MTAAEILRCDCGRWSGERCEAHAAVDDMTVVAWVPEQARGTAAALGLSSIAGCGRARLTEGLLVTRECAQHMRQHDPTWVEIIGEVAS